MNGPDAAGLALALGGRRVGRAYLARCPAHPDRDPSLRLWDGPDGMPRVRCYAGCDWRDVRAELASLGLVPGRDDPGPDRAGLARRALAREQALREEREAAEAAALAAWRTARPIRPGDLADRYLAGRGLPRPADGWPASLRLGTHASASGRTWPALLAAACRWPERHPVLVQATPLAEPGVKAWREPQRLGIGWPTGAAVRLAPWEPGRRLVLVEGVEDGLAVLAACPDAAPWAVLGAANAGAARLPDGAEVTLCLDGDAAGRRAALAAVHELRRRGHPASVAALPDGLDPLDLLLRAGP